MSVYTTQVRFICETMAGLDESVGYSGVNDVIQAAIPKIFDFDFPIYDESYRNVLCTKILKHYYTREIGAETYGLWKLWLDTRLNEIMPYYNELYKSALLEYSPLHTVNLTRDYDRNADDSRTIQSETASRSNSNTQTDGTNRNLYSDTPQGALNGVEDETYLSSASKVIDENSSESYGETQNDYSEENAFTSTEKYVEKIVGVSPGTNVNKLLMDFRKTLLNIDVMIIGELSDLFMNIF